MKVPVEVEETFLENDEGIEVEGVCVMCTRCDHSVEVFGRSEKSILRGCAMLREDCPENEENFYAVQE
jgi:hypothetical protein